MSYNTTAWTTDGQTQTTGGTTLYTHFGANSEFTSNFTAGTHYAIPFLGFGGYAAEDSRFSLGTSTLPDTSKSFSVSGNLFICKYWHIIDNITIDKVVWWHAGDAATGEVTKANLVSYAVDTDNGATSGDLSGGTFVAAGADITNAGYEQAYYQELTLVNANIPSGRVLLFTFRSDTSVNSDYSINATVKYHLT
tara:strand:+ start:1408 stop:1989 length:582 start_codon:yes stop_codon:yes gene_type:complete